MKLRLWLVRLLLGSSQLGVSKLDANAKHLIFVSQHALSPDQVASIEEFVGACMIVPVAMHYLPEGTRIRDIVEFYELA